LKHRCLKWVCMTHLDIWNTSYGQKKGRESNWQFDYRPLKVRNQPDFLMCRWRVTYCWKALDKGYNFALDLISIEGIHTKLWGPKVTRVPTLGILGLSGQNAIWMWASWRDTKYTIRGKVVASLKSGPWWILWVRICLWFILTPKMLQLCTNQLVVWFCVGPCEWLVACHSSYSHPGAPACPSTPKVLRTRECAPTFCFYIVFTLDSPLSLSRSLGACQKEVLAKEGGSLTSHNLGAGSNFMWDPTYTCKIHFKWYKPNWRLSKIVNYIYLFCRLANVA
jgi:hypothetical protein